MHRGLVSILTGVCVGVIGGSFLALFVMVSPVPAAIFGLFFAFPYVLMLLAGIGYSHCRVTLWGLIVATALMGGTATVFRGWLAYHAVTHPAPPPRPGTKNCGPPVELLACLLVIPENVAAPFFIVMAVGVGVVFGRD